MSDRMRRRPGGGVNPNEERTMYWNVQDNEPPMAGRGFTVLLDGDEVEKVTELDTDEGYVVKYCQGEKGDGHAEDIHRDLGDSTGFCRVRREGHVEILDSEGAKISDPTPENADG